MKSYNTDINAVYKKLKKLRGENKKSPQIPFLETLEGVFSGEEVLEGFRRNTELLCSENRDDSEHTFHNECTIDDAIIFDLAMDDNVNVPEMTLDNLKFIIFKKLKLNKACDLYKLTVEHLRYCGDSTLMLILKLINLILKDLSCLSSTHMNTSIASVIHKGKGKPITHHKSYRQVRVTPILARIIDEHLRPNLVNLSKPIQNSSQYGFTPQMSYLLGALQRHEAEKFCIDNKFTFFGCSLDGEAAFEVVDRTILRRELYLAGETGEFWLANNYTYQNTKSRIKLNGFLSKTISESKGVKQGQIKSSDHYKIYVNPLLDMIDSANLGIQIGPVNVSQSACADDEYLITNSQTKLQSLLNVAEFYGKMYNVKYGAAKTKITIVGSKIDRQYYQDISPWHLDGEKIEVATDNEHLGQIVSGMDQESKNVDSRISKGRQALFSLLGPAYHTKCLLSPAVKHHLFKTYISPIIRSGLSSFALQNSHLVPLNIFHRKILRGILNFSRNSNIPALHFLLGDLPIEGQIHRDIFSLFYSVWSNPQSKIYALIKYLLQTSPPNSRTWAVHVRFLAQKYEIDDPLELMKLDAPSRESFKELVETKIVTFYEKDLRRKASENSRMLYLNVDLLSLRGRCHPSLANIHTTHDVKKAQFHMKMLGGDYLTFEKKASQSGGSPHCRACETSEKEDILHIVSKCTAYTEIRNRIKQQYTELSQNSKTKIQFKNIDESTFCQFILDPSSMNLKTRISISDPALERFFQLSRDFCYTLHVTRKKILEHQNNNYLTQY